MSLAITLRHTSTRTRPSRQHSRVRLRPTITCARPSRVHARACSGNVPRAVRNALEHEEPQKPSEMQVRAHVCVHVCMCCACVCARVCVCVQGRVCVVSVCVGGGEGAAAALRRCVLAVVSPLGQGAICRRMRLAAVRHATPTHGPLPLQAAEAEGAAEGRGAAEGASARRAKREMTDAEHLVGHGFQVGVEKQVVSDQNLQTPFASSCSRYNRRQCSPCTQPVFTSCVQLPAAELSDPLLTGFTPAGLVLPPSLLPGQAVRPQPHDRRPAGARSGRMHALRGLHMRLQPAGGGQGLFRPQRAAVQPALMESVPTHTADNTTSYASDAGPRRRGCSRQGLNHGWQQGHDQQGRRRPAGLSGSCRGGALRVAAQRRGWR